MRLPRLPDGFEPEFLTRLLHAAGTLQPDARVRAVTVQRIAEGTGMMAELARLLVTCDGAAGDVPVTLVAKYASQSETNRAIAEQYNLPERETRFLAELAPRAAVRTPHVYFAGREGDRFLILMEDLGDYQVGSQTDGATLQQAGLALDELARLHAAFWDATTSLKWVPGVADSYHADNMRALAPAGFDGVAARFADDLPDGLLQWRSAFLDAIPHLQSQMAEAPLTLCHGDFRMANLLFGHGAGQAPVVVLDWQGPLRGRGMIDVALFLAQSTRTDVRRAAERELLERYRAGLAAGGVVVPRSDALWQDYRRAVLYNWLYAFVVAGTLDVGNAEGRAWMSRMVARQAATAEDLQVYELMPR